MHNGVGGYVLAETPIEINAGRPTLEFKVRNTGDRPIQVGSHFHFFEANRALEFDRAAAFGMRLDIPAATAMRFEPGDERTVTLVPFGGTRRIFGFNNLADGWVNTDVTYQPNLQRSIDLARELGYKFSNESEIK